MRSFFVLALAALLSGACVPPPEDVDRIPNFDPEETIMGRIQERGTLEVGLASSIGPPFVVADDAAEEPQGFLIDLSQELAEALGVEPEFEFLDDDDAILPGRLKVDPPVDISFVSRPATEELAKGHPLTHPYWVAHQRVLAPVGSGIGEWTDIDDTYCSIIDEETGFDPAGAAALDGIEGDVVECARLLRRGDVDAVTAPDMTLMGVWAELTDCDQPCPPSEDYGIVGDQLTTAGYSAMLPVGSPGWTSFVNATWGEAESEGRWLDYYEEWIAPFGIELDEAPDMRIEEAAGLYPCRGPC